MVLLTRLVFTLTFYELVVGLHAISCPKGHKVNNRNTGCNECPDGYYQPEENRSQMCRPCAKCEKNWGSSVKNKCTKQANTECQCLGGYIPLDEISSTCKCNIGFGIKNKECLKCEEGYFTTTINSICKEWKKCDSGVKTNGTSTSDVTCNDSKRKPDATTPHLPCSASSCPPEKDPSQTQHTPTPTPTTTTTTPAPPAHTVTTKRTTTPFPSSNGGNHIGMALLMGGIFGMLVLTAVTCRLHITPCVRERQRVPTKSESLYRRPVEESGGNGSLSSLKLNLGEP